MLTKRETEVLEKLADGSGCKEIGKLLNISETTVITHKNHLKRKFKAKNVCHLIKLAATSGYIVLYQKQKS